MSQRVLTATEVRAILRVSRATVYRMADAGVLHRTGRGKFSAASFEGRRHQKGAPLMSTGTATPTTAKEYVVRPTEAPAVEHGAIRATIEEITPELAELYLKILEYTGQRKVRQFHVERLAKEMERGTFRPGSMIEIMQFDGREYLINGQHRLHAVVEWKTPQTFTVQTTKATSMEQVAFAYGRTDIGMKRSTNDLFIALDTANQLNLPTTRSARELGATIRFMLTGFTTTGGAMRDTTPIETILEHMVTYAPTMLQYHTLSANCENRMRASLFRSATLGVALLTLRFAAPYAATRGDPSVEDFWKGVIFDDGLVATDPRKLGYRHIRDTAMAGGASAKDRSQFTTAARSSRYLAHCFNAYIARRQITHVKVHDDTAPLKLYGVPSAEDAWW